MPAPSAAGLDAARKFLNRLRDSKGHPFRFGPEVAINLAQQFDEVGQAVFVGTCKGFELCDDAGDFIPGRIDQLNELIASWEAN